MRERERERKSEREREIKVSQVRNERVVVKKIKEMRRRQRVHQPHSLRHPSRPAWPTHLHLRGAPAHEMRGVKAKGAHVKKKKAEKRRQKRRLLKKSSKTSTVTENQRFNMAALCTSRRGMV